MRSGRRIHMLLVILLFTGLSYGQNGKMIDHLNVPGPIVFDNVAYSVAWTSHPSTTYYKQEYIKKGDVVSKFGSMLLMEVLTGKAKIKDVLDAKVAELKSMQAANPFITYEIISNPPKGEYMLDFLVTDNAPDGKSVRIAERNIYRYRTYTDKTGENGIILIGISVRSYGGDTKKFIELARSNKNELVGKAKQFTIPAITIR